MQSDAIREAEAEILMTDLGSDEGEIRELNNTLDTCEIYRT